MKSLKPSHVIVALGATAVVLWGWQVERMSDRGLLDFTPNPAALGGSPYGRTLAMVVQGPVDTYWHGGAEPGHVHGPECNHEQGTGNTGASAAHRGEGVVARAKEMVGHLDRVVRERNTPYGQSQAHVRYLHRQIERKLESAYWLDPGNYVNFNAFLLFLTESAVATREVSPERVRYFADRTIAHVEQNERVNPEPWLTAASAVQVKMETIHRMGGGKEPSRAELEQLLRQFEHCLARFAFLRDIQVNSKRWVAISPARRSAMDDRARQLEKLLDAQQRLLKDSSSTPTAH